MRSRKKKWNLISCYLRYFKTVAEAFQEKYPNVKFEYTPVENGDLIQKYKTAQARAGRCTAFYQGTAGNSLD